MLMKRRLNRKKKLSPKTWILQHDHDQQGAYNNSVRELELYKVRPDHSLKCSPVNHAYTFRRIFDGT